MRKYFPADLRKKKEVKFLQLRQGSMSVVSAAKFKELSRFCPFINVKGVEVSKCVKFESGLCPEIYRYVSIFEIRDFDTLVNKCHIFDEAGKAKESYDKAVKREKEMVMIVESLMARIRERIWILVVAPSQVGKR